MSTFDFPTTLSDFDDFNSRFAYDLSGENRSIELDIRRFAAQIFSSSGSDEPLGFRRQI
jgi:hypothetical protein